MKSLFLLVRKTQDSELNEVEVLVSDQAYPTREVANQKIKDLNKLGINGITVKEIKIK